MHQVLRAEGCSPFGGRGCPFHRLLASGGGVVPAPGGASSCFNQPAHRTLEKKSQGHAVWRSTEDQAASEHHDGSNPGALAHVHKSMNLEGPHCLKHKTFFNPT